MEPNVQSQASQPQGGAQAQNVETPAPNPQAGEGIGMSKSFSENPSMEMLNNRRIDQIVSAREQERARAVQAVQDAETKGKTEGHQAGLLTGRDQGLEVGFIKGHMDGQEHGKQQMLASGSAVPNQGLGSSLPIQNA